MPPAHLHAGRRGHLMVFDFLRLPAHLRQPAASLGKGYGKKRDFSW